LILNKPIWCSKIHLQTLALAGRFEHLCFINLADTGVYKFVISKFILLKQIPAAEKAVAGTVLVIWFSVAKIHLPRKLTSIQL
jgi:hypothetical protein